ncbi:MAG: coproporphyrinogen dehydrogenase HemZ [Clostridiales bacterium]|nr:coproporphyrinogen dehydrogenase HemZ [Clostridiales bacterium]
MVIYVLSSIPEYSNELTELVRVFYPGIVTKSADSDFTNYLKNDLIIVCNHENVNGLHKDIKITIQFLKDSKIEPFHTKHCLFNSEAKESHFRRDLKNKTKLLLYEALVEVKGYDLEWGSLTGVRPVGIVHNLMDRGLDSSHIQETLYSDYRISKQKAKLILDIARIQRPYFAYNNPNQVSIYINIPICTTKCFFCSFPSAILAQCAYLVDDYILALDKEMGVMAKLAREKGISIQTVYIGGGTPTSLNLTQLNAVLSSVKENWGENTLMEYTVEGGRPDTMDKAKLELLKDYKVSRISINPQTMNDRTLKLIGRNHNSVEIIKCFNMAKEIGFNSINMDVIVGLPGEGIEESQKTMASIIDLKPDNFTVHALAIKRASRLKENIYFFSSAEVKVAKKMMDIYYQGAESMGMRPYYLYRQKYMLGNMENIGFALPGKESVYNIQMMEDRQTVWAFGAGAISKFYFSEENRIERAPNVKNIEEYIKRIDEMIDRKMKLTL